MKFKLSRIAFLCLSTLGVVSQVQAVQVAGENLEVYGTLYPEYDVTTYGDGSAAGTASNSMQSKKTVAGNLAASTTPLQKSQIAWSQSYIGFKGKKSVDDLTLGYDFQGVMGKNIDSSAGTGGTQSLFTDTRDAFVSIGLKGVGTAQFGQMDTVYKEFGDRTRLLDVSSSNFISTSNVLSNVGWKSAGGTTSFHTRIGNQIRLISDSFNGFQAGFSYHPDENRTATQNQWLSAIGIRWSNENFYASLHQETHNDYRTFSGTGATEATSTLVSASPGSKDTGTRLSLQYDQDLYSIAAEFANLKYTENAQTVGKFTSYTHNTYALRGEFKVQPRWTLGANYAYEADGSCTILGGAVCTTNGLNGSLTSVGAKYSYSKDIALFMLYAANRNASNATISSSAVGGNITNVAAGVLLKF
jgi:predicted porin